MSGTVQYGEEGAIDPNLEAVKESRENLRDAQGEDNYQEEGGEDVVDPSAQTGTLDTTDTTDLMQSADNVSPVFDQADEASANSEVPEGVIQTPTADPAAEGEDSLSPGFPEPGGVSGQAAGRAGTEDDRGDGTVGGGSASTATASGSDDTFDASKDPGDYRVAEITAFLKGASDEDVRKVQKAEAKGQGRKHIADFKKS